MKDAKGLSKQDSDIAYQIKVQGKLDKSWSNWFNEMTITSERTQDDVQMTTFSGPIADQVALRGILTKIWDLNLILISVERHETHLNKEN